MNSNGISKNFVVKNGLEVDTDTLFVDHVNRRTGIATTTPRDNLDVRGGIIATTVTADNLVLNQGLEFINAAGIATFVGLVSQTYQLVLVVHIVGLM